MYDSRIVIEQLQKLKMEIEDQSSIIQKRTKNVPPGMLRCSKQWNKYQYYYKADSNDAHGTYIHAKDRKLAVKLAQKDYDKRLLTTLEDQLKVIDRFLKHYDPNAAIKVYEDLSEARKLLVTPEYLPDEEYVKQWLSTPYRKLPFNPGDPEYYTANHERVRSKSEIIIANTLKSYNIPYRYEFPVYEDGIPIGAPDFNCLNVRLRKEYYWEHLGMIGDEKYVNRNIIKLEKYTMAKDFDESRLILTFESDKRPLNTRIIEEKIRKYLL